MSMDLLQILHAATLTQFLHFVQVSALCQSGMKGSRQQSLHQRLISSPLLKIIYDNCLVAGSGSQHRAAWTPVMRDCNASDLPDTNNLINQMEKMSTRNYSLLQLSPWQMPIIAHFFHFKLCYLKLLFLLAFKEVQYRKL